MSNFDTIFLSVLLFWASDDHPDIFCLLTLGHWCVRPSEPADGVLIGLIYCPKQVDIGHGELTQNGRVHFTIDI